MPTLSTCAICIGGSCIRAFVGLGLYTVRVWTYSEARVGGRMELRAVCWMVFVAICGRRSLVQCDVRGLAPSSEYNEYAHRACTCGPTIYRTAICYTEDNGVI